MAFTQTDIDLLKSAISAGRGARTISFGDQSVTFHSVAEMIELLRIMEADVATTAGTPRTRYGVVDKGV